MSCSLNLLNSCDTELSRSWSLSCAVGIEKAYTQHYSRVCTKSFPLLFSINRSLFRFSLLLHPGNQNFASADFPRNLIVPSLLGLPWMNWPIMSFAVVVSQEDTGRNKHIVTKKNFKGATFTKVNSDGYR